MRINFRPYTWAFHLVANEVHPRIYLISCVESKDEKNEIKHPSKISTFTVYKISRCGNPPWFCKQLPQPTTDDIELRLGAESSISNEDSLLEIVNNY